MDVRAFPFGKLSTEIDPGHFAGSAGIPGMNVGSGAQWFRQRIGELRLNPGFGNAAVTAARRSVQLFEGRYFVNKALANVARQTICVAIMSAYFGQAERDGGASLSSIQTLTTALGVCSKNTAAANIALLEGLGLILRRENVQDHRSQYIQPTEMLVSAATELYQIFLDAADDIEPGAAYRSSYDADAGIRERCAAAGIYSYIALHSSVFASDRSKTFVNAEGGLILLYKLMSMEGMDHEADGFSVEFPFEETGSLFGLSRTHIRRLLKKAEAEGLLRVLRKGGRRVQILPPLVDLFENTVAASIVRSRLDMHLATSREVRSTD